MNEDYPERKPITADDARFLRTEWLNEKALNYKEIDNQIQLIASSGEESMVVDMMDYPPEKQFKLAETLIKKYEERGFKCEHKHYVEEANTIHHYVVISWAE